MNDKEFLTNLKELGIIPTSTQINALSLYASYLLEYNQHTNLTSIKSIEEVYLKHFYDSLTITKIIDLNEVSTVLDIGTGAGFPGMVLKIMFPHLELTLLDSNNKKIKFLKELANKLNIKLNLIHDRAENYLENNRETFDLVVSRAVAPLPILSELSIPFLKVNGHFIAMKSSIESELSQSKDILNKLNSKVTSIEEFNLPIENSKRTLIKITKHQTTPLKYPRRYDIIKKSYSKLNSK